MSIGVLLLHGIGGGRAIWPATVDALATAGHEVLAIDFPGYGGHPGAPTMAAMVDAVGSALGELRGTRKLIVGHSMGGMVAQAFVAAAPAAAQGLVLACTSASFGKSDGAWQAKFVADRLAPLDAGLGMAGMAEKLVPAMVAPGADAAAMQASIAVMSRVPEATYRTALQAIAAFDGREALPQIAVPTLCLAAEHDRTAPPAVLQRMAERIPGAEYECLADAGHIANVEQPAAFNAALLRFIARHFDQ